MKSGKMDGKKNISLILSNFSGQPWVPWSGRDDTPPAADPQPVCSYEWPHGAAAATVTAAAATTTTTTTATATTTTTAATTETAGAEQTR